MTHNAVTVCRSAFTLFERYNPPDVYNTKIFDPETTCDVGKVEVSKLDCVCLCIAVS